MREKTRKKAVEKMFGMQVPDGDGAHGGFHVSMDGEDSRPLKEFIRVRS